MSKKAGKSKIGSNTVGIIGGVFNRRLKMQTRHVNTRIVTAVFFNDKASRLGLKIYSEFTKGVIGIEFYLRQQRKWLIGTVVCGRVHILVFTQFNRGVIFITTIRCR